MTRDLVFDGPGARIRLLSGDLWMAQEMLFSCVMSNLIDWTICVLCFIKHKMLRPQDILVVLKQRSWLGRQWQRQELAAEIGISPAEVTFSMKRLARSGLVGESGVRKSRFAKFLIHGVPVVWPGELGSDARGMPTAWGVIAIEENQPSGGPVWPTPVGKARGPSIEPLYKTVPEAAARDELLHRWLALIDMMRVGNARERRFAEKTIGQELGK